MIAKVSSDRYFEALGLDPGCEQDRDKLKAALSRAHDIRKVELDLYWKRATYLWAFQAVAFAALGLFLKNGVPESDLIVVPEMFGFVTSIAGYLSARGSKFWQENWEAHTDMLEPEFEGRLFQVIVVRRGLEFSVTQINERLLILLSIGWVFSIAWFAVPGVLELIRAHSHGFFRLVPTAFVLVGAGYLLAARTRLDGLVFRSGAAAWVRFERSGKKDQGSIVLRDSAIGTNPKTK